MNKNYRNNPGFPLCVLMLPAVCHFNWNEYFFCTREDAGSWLHPGNDQDNNKRQSGACLQLHSNTGPLWKAVQIQEVISGKRNTMSLYMWYYLSFKVTTILSICHRYLYVRLDGTMSIKKRAKIVERFNSPSVSSARTKEIPVWFQYHINSSWPTFEPI